MKRPLRLVHVFTVADSLIFIAEQVALARRQGFDVTVIASPDDRLDAFGRTHGVRTLGVEMPRRVSVAGDWAALDELTRYFRAQRPDVVHAHTPKGGLLGTLAAQAARVPVRLYQMRGLAYVTAQGPLKLVLQGTERLSCAAATRVFCQSHSLRRVALSDRLASEDKLGVILRGSNGVDTEGRFSPQRLQGQRAALRARFGLPQGALVFAFVGRLVKDKGVPELVRAFARLSGELDDAWLLVAGPFEAKDAVDAGTRSALESHPRIRHVGFVADPSIVYAASDLVVLPSHREGFPNVPLEAASMGLPVVSTRTAGCVDAVDDGVTGTLIDVGDEAGLFAALERYASSPELRAAHGAAGRAMAERDFRREVVSQAMLDATGAELRRAGYDI